MQENIKRVFMVQKIAKLETAIPQGRFLSQISVLPQSFHKTSCRHVYWIRYLKQLRIDGQRMCLLHLIHQPMPQYLFALLHSHSHLKSQGESREHSHKQTPSGQWTCPPRLSSEHCSQQLARCCSPGTTSHSVHRNAFWMIASTWFAMLLQKMKHILEAWSPTLILCVCFIYCVLKCIMG